MLWSIATILERPNSNAAAPRRAVPVAFSLSPASKAALNASSVVGRLSLFHSAQYTPLWCIFSRHSLYLDPLGLVEADFVVPPVIKLGGSCAGMIGHEGGILQRPPYFKYAVIPVALKLWLPTLVAIPAAAARRQIMA